METIFLIHPNSMRWQKIVDIESKLFIKHVNSDLAFTSCQPLTMIYYCQLSCCFAYVLQDNSCLYDCLLFCTKCM